MSPKKDPKINELQLVFLFSVLLSLLVIVIPPCLAYVFARKQQIQADERRLKETYYLNLIEALSKDVLSKYYKEGIDQLCDTSNQLLLMSRSQVVQNLLLLMEYVAPSNSQAFDPETHNQLLSGLIKSMRNDLFKNSMINQGYPYLGMGWKQTF